MTPALMKFIFHLPPQVKERPRQGRNRATGAPMFFTPARTRKFEALVGAEVREQMRLEGWAPFAEKIPLAAFVRFTFSIQDKKRWGQFKPTSPDSDNLVKSVLDSMNELAFHDDGQVVIEMGVKGYGQRDKIEVFLYPVALARFMDFQGVVVPT